MLKSFSITGISFKKKLNYFARSQYFVMSLDYDHQQGEPRKKKKKRFVAEEGILNELKKL